MKISEYKKTKKLAVLASLLLLQPLQASAADMSNWMGDLNENLVLSDLSMPGTHNSVSVRGYGTVWAECQEKTILQQLKMGIRVFDLRVRPTGKSLALHHGEVFLNQMLGDVLLNFKSFLSSHPNETIFVRIAKAHVDSESGSGSVTSNFMRYWNNSTYAPYFWKPSSSNQNPKLSAVRGKIVVLKSSYMDYDRMPNVKTPNWGTFDVQDKYNVPTIFDIPGKWTQVQGQLAKSSNLNNKKVHVNFTSGVGSPTPAYVAQFVNSDLKSYLDTKGQSFRTGIVMMDFPNRTSGLVESIVSKNKVGKCQWLSNNTGEWENTSSYSTRKQCETANKCGYGACYRWNL